MPHALSPWTSSLRLRGFECVMTKEVSFSAYRMSNRLVSKQEMSYMADETESNMPSFLRKKESEGRGRRNQK